MSNYIKKAKHPKTGKLTFALFRDNHFGRREYGVGFRKDGGDTIYIGMPLEDLEFFREEDLSK